MQTPSGVLNIGADVAKDAIVVDCSEGSFSAHEIANQHTALLAFLKSLPAGSRIGVHDGSVRFHDDRLTVSLDGGRLDVFSPKSSALPASRE